MYKKTSIILLGIIIMLFITSLCYAKGTDDEEEVLDKEKIIEEQMKNLQIDELQKLITEINNSSGKYLPKINFKEFMISLIKGEEVLTSKEIIDGILKLTFNEVIGNSVLLAQLLVLAIISAVLANLQSAFEKDTIGQLAHYVCYIIIVSIIIKSFVVGMNIGRETIEQMVIFMQALLPTLITLLVAVGGITSSALFEPIILGSISAISAVIKDIILPLIFFSVIIGLISKISKKIQISRLSGLLRQVSVVVIGVLLTIFLGIMSIQGVTASQVDGVTIRTAKFAIDTFIPIVGGFLSDAMDTVVGCSMLLKNAVGVIGLIALFIICVMPGIKLMSLIFIYKFTSAIIEPISDGKVVDCLNEISKALILVLGTVLSIGVMFFIAITIIVGAGNVTVMLR